MRRVQPAAGRLSFLVVLVLAVGAGVLSWLLLAREHSRSASHATVPAHDAPPTVADSPRHRHVAKRAPLRRGSALPRNVYADDGANMLSGAARLARPLVYVPNSESASVDVIDPRTYKVVAHFPVGALPQPSYRRST